MKISNSIDLLAVGAALALGLSGGIGWSAAATTANAQTPPQSGGAMAPGATQGRGDATPGAPHDAAGLPATGPFIPCGPNTGSAIGQLPGPYRANPVPAGAGRGPRGGGQREVPTMAGGKPIPKTTDPKILAAMKTRVDPRGGNGGQPNACNWANNQGFVSIFDGTMKGWDGDPRFWSAVKNDEGDMVLQGLSTVENPSGNQYLTYRNIKARDFDFKADVRIPNGGSGLQYRSVTGIQWRVYAGPGGVYQSKWMVTGPQSDFFAGNHIYNGQAYSENTPMGIEAFRGQVVEQWGNDRSRKNLVGIIGPFDTLASAWNPDGWNHMEIITRGPVLMHFMNGQLTSLLIDDDPKSSNNQSGMFALEMELPTLLQMKNVYVKKLN